MIIVLYGGDELGMRRRMQELKDEADGGTGMLTTNHTILDGREAKVADIVAPAMAVPFLAPRRLVVVDNLLERYEPNANEQQRQPRSVGPWEPLFPALEQIPETTLLVFIGVGCSNKNPLVDRLKKLPSVLAEEYPELKGEALTRYIRGEGAARGIRFRSGPPQRRHVGIEEWERAGLDDKNGRAITEPAELLRTILGGDTLAIGNELDKLAHYTMGRDATLDDVFEVSAGAREFDNFAFADAVMDGQLERALHIVESLHADGIEDAGLLAVLLGAYRRLAPVVDLVEHGGSQAEIAAAMGRSGQYGNLREAAIRRARALGTTGLRRAYELLVEADRTHKLGEIDEVLALEVVVMRLAALAQQGVPARR